MLLFCKVTPTTTVEPWEISRQNVRKGLAPNSMCIITGENEVGENLNTHFPEDAKL